MCGSSMAREAAADSEVTSISQAALNFKCCHLPRGLGRSPGQNSSAENTCSLGVTVHRANGLHPDRGSSWLSGRGCHQPRFTDMEPGWPCLMAASDRGPGLHPTGRLRPLSQPHLSGCHPPPRGAPQLNYQWGQRPSSSGRACRVFGSFCLGAEGTSLRLGSAARPAGPRSARACPTTPNAKTLRMRRMKNPAEKHQQRNSVPSVELQFAWPFSHVHSIKNNCGKSESRLGGCRAQPGREKSLSRESPRSPSTYK